MDNSIAWRYISHSVGVQLELVVTFDRPVARTLAASFCYLRHIYSYKFTLVSLMSPNVYRILCV